MANQFLNAQEYANVMLLLLKNQLVYGRLVDGQFKDQVTDENGLTVNVKRPPRFIDKKDGTAALAAQDIVTGTAPVTVDQYSKVHISVGDIEYITSFNALMQNETMKSAASTLAHSVDKFIASKTKLFHSWVAGNGTTGGVDSTDPTIGVKTAAQAMGAHTRLMNQGVPNSDIRGVLTFTDAELIRGGLLSSYTPQINRSMLEKVRIPLISEIDWYATQQNPVFTTGTRLQGNGTSTGSNINGAAQNVNYRDVKGSAGVQGMTQSLIVKEANGITTTIKAGEVFTIQNVFAWDWRANQILPYLQQFTVLADATYNGASPAVATLTIQPAIIVQGTSDGISTDANTAFATVNAAPADGAFIQWAGAASTNLTVRSAFHKRAISLVSARLQMPFTGVASFAVDPDTGVAIRYWRGSDISTGAHIHRWDMMYGGTVLDSFLGTRVAGS